MDVDFFFFFPRFCRKEFECSSCGESLPADEFSSNQLKKGDERRCKVCVEMEEEYEKGMRDSNDS